MSPRLRVTPTTAIALAALFFALGGSAFAIVNKVAPQARCATGAVRGVAMVIGDPSKGIANMPDQFTSSGVYFARRFNCKGGTIQVRRVDTGLYEVRFIGNPAQTAIASAIAEDGSSAAVNRLPDGTFRVTIRGGGQSSNPLGLHDTPFTIVLL